MTPTLTKFFLFSASFSRDKKIIGHNYRLGVTMAAVTEEAEVLLCDKIERGLIQKIHSRDLSLHVEFLKSIEITDQNLLKVFWDRIGKEIEPVSLLSLSLERDERTRTTLSVVNT